MTGPKKGGGYIHGSLERIIFILLQNYSHNLKKYIGRKVDFVEKEAYNCDNERLLLLMLGNNVALL